MSAEPADPARLSGPSGPAMRLAGHLAAAVAAAVLAGSGTGSAAVAAVLLGVAVADRRTGAAALLAVLAAGVRFRTDAFGDLAGLQSVLGIAGEVGPPTAAASAWLSAVAVLLAAAPLAGAAGARVATVPALPAGVLAAALVAGPGPDRLGTRVLASLVCVALAAGVVALRRRLGAPLAWLAVAAGLAAVVLAGWPA